MQIHGGFKYVQDLSPLYNFKQFYFEIYLVLLIHYYLKLYAYEYPLNLTNLKKV